MYEGAVSPVRPSEEQIELLSTTFNTTYTWNY